MKVRFTRGFSLRIHPLQMKEWPKDWSGTIKREWGEQAVAAGAAVELVDATPVTPPPAGAGADEGVEPQ